MRLRAEVVYEKNQCPVSAPSAIVAARIVLKIWIEP